MTNVMKEEESPKMTGISLIRESRVIEENFINTYKNLPELWDTEHKDYTNKLKRNAALDILLKVMKRWNPASTRFSVRQKINILRSCYRKDLRKYLASKRIGQSGEEVYEHEPRSWKFQALRFLDKDKRDHNDIVEINMDDNNFEDEVSNGLSSGNDEPSQASDVLAILTKNEPLKQRYINKHKNKCVKLEIEDEYYAENNNMLDRELEAIGANVTCKLKRMNPEQRYHAELLINKVLITGLKNNLTEETDLTEVYKT